jgi:hypothetical protein
MERGHRILDGSAVVTDLKKTDKNKKNRPAHFSGDPGRNAGALAAVWRYAIVDDVAKAMRRIRKIGKRTAGRAA